jgi:hypothetical protein
MFVICGIFLALPNIPQQLPNVTQCPLVSSHHMKKIIQHLFLALTKVLAFFVALLKSLDIPIIPLSCFLTSHCCPIFLKKFLDVLWHIPNVVCHPSFRCFYMLHKVGWNVQIVWKLWWLYYSIKHVECCILFCIWCGMIKNILQIVSYTNPFLKHMLFPKGQIIYGDMCFHSFQIQCIKFPQNFRYTTK